MSGTRIIKQLLAERNLTLNYPNRLHVGWGFLWACTQYPLVQRMGIPTENKPFLRNVFVCWRESDIPVHPVPCPVIQLTGTK